MIWITDFLKKKQEDKTTRDVDRRIILIKYV